MAALVGTVVSMVAGMVNAMFDPKELMLYILTNHRSLIVVVFGLPLSLLWDAALAVRAVWVRLMKSAPSQHDKRVADIVRQVRARPKDMPLCTARPGWMSISLSYRTYKQKWKAVEMPLIDIINIDTAGRTITVEPFVSMGQLTRALLPLGFTLPIVPEMDDLTVGGLVNGTGIESTSHRYGLFHEICEEFELCLGDGTVVRASETENAELFHAIPWSYGTLALLLSARLKIVPCKKYVKVTYTPHHDRTSAINHFRELSEAPADEAPMFVEGLMYSPSDSVIMAGEFVDEAPWMQINGLHWWWKPWFYKHVETLLSRDKPKVEYIPLRDYYHRHSKSMFWEMELMIPIGNHPVFRWLMGWLMPPKVSFLKVTQTEMTRQLTERTHVAQDFLVPTDKMGYILDVCDEQYDKIYPIWLCPHKHGKMPGSLLKDPPAPGPDGTQMYVDIGVYGLPRCVHEKREELYDMKKAMRAVEKELREVTGFEMLYADIYCTRQEFEEMYDHESYRKLREKYKATTAFKEVYDKMNVKV